MSQRELQTKPITLIAVAGVNQRVVDTEQAPQEYSLVEGVFPEFAGLQSRLWGKRLLKKYDLAIYGIHQFWTPMGYGGGLYQFDGTVDYGPWLTPTSNFDLTPPLLPFDGGNMTLDEFGNSYGGNFGYGTDNACVISFLDGSNQHAACQPAPTNVSTPNDSNGGPAGQGKHCQWQQGDDEDDALPAIVGYQYGTAGNTTDVASTPLPYPIDPTMPSTEPTVYTGTAGPFGMILYGSASISSAKINLGGGNWREIQAFASDNTKAVLDFSGLVDPANPPATVEFKVRHNGNAPFDIAYVPVAGLTITEDGNYRAYPVNVWDYIFRWWKQADNALGGGFVFSDFIVIQGVRIKYNTRVCE